jgi:hypothetical protein
MNSNGCAEQEGLLQEHQKSTWLTGREGLQMPCCVLLASYTRQRSQQLTSERADWGETMWCSPNKTKTKLN